MMDSLSALVITFAVMSLISVAGVALLYLIRNEKTQKGIFYFLTIWGMAVAYCNALATPFMQTGGILIAWGLGALSVIALLLQLVSKRENKFEIARILVTISVVAGMIDCFWI